MRKTVLAGSMFLMMFTGASGAYAETTDKDCADFSSREEMMQFWYSNGYSAINDPHRLDGDGDGLACEVSKSEYDAFVAAQTGDANGGTTPGEETAEGEKLPATASSNPLIILIGAGAAAAGSLLLFRRKRQEA
ncbi:excalibur calcium-binding domain-containing protein [Planococcus sp. FY231025]|uniref:excalibur calcium-binding domain-containing protein n=1 Tax=Planococcus sp. FY231025 TaxID=3455699 RepID=UPI003F8FF76B